MKNIELTDVDIIAEAYEEMYSSNDNDIQNLVQQIVDCFDADKNREAFDNLCDLAFDAATYYGHQWFENVPYNFENAFDLDTFKELVNCLKYSECLSDDVIEKLNDEQVIEKLHEDKLIRDLFESVYQQLRDKYEIADEYDDEYDDMIRAAAYDYYHRR